uniref:Uncharacterized protein n=1 Tax=Solanum tuberosum TaxID=4113 RepID=M1DXB2_SOLTU
MIWGKDQEAPKNKCRCQQRWGTTVRGWTYGPLCSTVVDYINLIIGPTNHGANLRTVVPSTGIGSRSSFSTCDAEISLSLGLTYEAYLRLVDWTTGNPGEPSKSTETYQLQENLTLGPRHHRRSVVPPTGRGWGRRS